MPLWVGLTGGIACGKSTVLEMLAGLGAVVFSADACVHELLATSDTLRRSIVERFGAEVLGADGWPDRRRLGAVVFSDDASREFLEALVHPLVHHRYLDWRQGVADASPDVAVAEIPLLFETDLDWQFDATVAVVSEQEVQLNRLVSKGLSRTQACSRIEAQMPTECKAGLATFVLNNNGSLEDLRSRVSRLWEDLLSASRSKGGEVARGA